MRFLTPFGLVVEFDGNYVIQVDVPPQYRGYLTGLCGNFDGILLNDGTECNGQSYTGADIELYGDTCIVPDNDLDAPT